MQYLLNAPVRMFQKMRSKVFFQMAMLRAVKECKIAFQPPPLKIRITATVAELETAGIPMFSDILEDSEVAAFAREAEYEFYYPGYYSGREMIRLKKIREHFMAARLLGLNKNDVYLDIASQYSPAPLVYERLFGCRVFRQDLEYPLGIHGRLIGGSAGCMPLYDRSVTKMALHCSLEHFEGDEDIAFMRESERVLAKGGMLVIVPLYLSDQYFISTQSSLWAHLSKEHWPVFDSDAIVCCSNSSTNRHERYYDALHFINRLVRASKMSVTVHTFGNSEYYAPGQMRFAAVFHKAN